MIWFPPQRMEIATGKSNISLSDKVPTYISDNGDIVDGLLEVMDRISEDATSLTRTAGSTDQIKDIFLQIQTSNEEFLKKRIAHLEAERAMERKGAEALYKEMDIISEILPQRVLEAQMELEEQNRVSTGQMIMQVFTFALKVIPLHPKDAIEKIPAAISATIDLVNGVSDIMQKEDHCPATIVSSLGYMLDQQMAAYKDEEKMKDELPGILEYASSKLNRQVKLTLNCVLKAEGNLALDNAVDNYFDAARGRLERIQNEVTLEREIKQLQLQLSESRENVQSVSDNVHLGRAQTSRQLMTLQAMFYEAEALFAQTLYDWCRIHEYHYLKSFEMEAKMRAVFAMDASVRSDGHKNVFFKWQRLRNDLKQWIASQKAWYKSQGTFQTTRLHFVINDTIIMGDFKEMRLAKIEIPAALNGDSM